ncbi:MAG: hypothetical protein ABEH86_07965 [Haloarcula sp.]
MSSTEEAPEDMVDTAQAGGLGEIIPEPLMPIWSRIEAIQEFRETHGDTYVTVLELLTGIALAAGYVWWMYIYLLGGTTTTI